MVLCHTWTPCCPPSSPPPAWWTWFWSARRGRLWSVTILFFSCKIYAKVTIWRKYITDIKVEEGDKEFQLTTRQGFRWWWAFTQKHNIISLYYQDNGDNQVTRRQSSSPENLLNLLNNKPSLSINIPSPSNHFLPFLSLTSQSRHSMNHLECRQPHTLWQRYDKATQNTPVDLFWTCRIFQVSVCSSIPNMEMWYFCANIG